MVRTAILTVSDGVSRGEREDRSGALLEAWCVQEGHPVVARRVVPDETHAIVPVLLEWCDGGEVDLVLTTGGTGFSPRDVTPEATLAVGDRRVPGLPEVLRQDGRASTPFAILSRGVSVVRGNTLVVNLPGSRGGVSDGIGVLEPVIRHAVDLLRDRETFHSPGSSAPPAPGRPE